MYQPEGVRSLFGVNEAKEEPDCGMPYHYLVMFYFKSQGGGKPLNGLKLGQWLDFVCFNRGSDFWVKNWLNEVEAKAGKSIMEAIIVLVWEEMGYLN